MIRIRNRTRYASLVTAFAILLGGAIPALSVMSSASATAPPLEHLDSKKIGAEVIRTSERVLDIDADHREKDQEPEPQGDDDPQDDNYALDVAVSVILFFLGSQSRTQEPGTLSGSQWSGEETQTEQVSDAIASTYNWLAKAQNWLDCTGLGVRRDCE